MLSSFQQKNPAVLRSEIKWDLVTINWLLQVLSDYEFFCFSICSDLGIGWHYSHNSSLIPGKMRAKTLKNDQKRETIFSFPELPSDSPINYESSENWQGAKHPVLHW
jgi:hypothetical protein